MALFINIPVINRYRCISVSDYKSTEPTEFVRVIFDFHRLKNMNYMDEKWEELFDEKGKSKGLHMTGRDIYQLQDFTENDFIEKMIFCKQDDIYSCYFIPKKDPFMFDVWETYCDMEKYLIVFISNNYGGWNGSIASNLSDIIEDELQIPFKDLFTIDKYSKYKYINAFIEILFIDGAGKRYCKRLSPRIALEKDHIVGVNTSEKNFKNNLTHFPKLNKASEADKLSYVFKELSGNNYIRKSYHGKSIGIPEY